MSLACLHTTLTLWSKVMLHWVEAVGEKRPLGETELACAAGPVTTMQKG
jgi:hypothetical protein